MTRPRVAAAGAVLCVLLVLVGVAAFGVDRADLAQAAIALSFALVGALLGNRRPENPIGWLFLGFGILGAINFVFERYAAQHGGAVAQSIAAHGWHPGFGLLVFTLLLFPEGRLLSPRWRWLARIAVVVYGGLALSGPFDADFLHEDFPGADPLVHGSAGRIGSGIFGTLLELNLLVLLAAGVSLVIRLRRATGVERQQVKWFITPVALIMFLFPLSVVAAGDGRFGVWLFPLIPVAAGVAVLKYRLYDIDVVIRRTLVYAALTVTLVGAYLIVVLLAQLVLPARSDLGVAVSTLAAAALFTPARRRIQSSVDRRFFRSRFDVQQTLTAFGARMRDELDLDALTGELNGVVAETMQPTHVSLWLR